MVKKTLSIFNFRTSFIWYNKKGQGYREINKEIKYEKKEKSHGLRHTTEIV